MKEISREDRIAELRRVIKNAEEELENLSQVKLIDSVYETGYRVIADGQIEKVENFWNIQELVKGNCFTTAEYAKDWAFKQMFEFRLLRLKQDGNDFGPILEDSFIYYVTINTDGELEIEQEYAQTDYPMIVFQSKEILEGDIKLHGEDWRKYIMICRRFSC